MQGFNFALCLYALVAVHMRNARAILLLQVAWPFTLLLDIVYCAVYTPQRPVPAIVFVCLNMFAKVRRLWRRVGPRSGSGAIAPRRPARHGGDAPPRPSASHSMHTCRPTALQVAMLLYGHRFLRELGGSYSLSTPVTFTAPDGAAGGSGSGGGVGGGHGAAAVGGGAGALPNAIGSGVAGDGAAGYHRMESGTGGLDTSAYGGGGGAASADHDKPLYTSYQGS